MTSTPASYVADPQWFPYRFDDANTAFRFRRLSRADHAGATFLTDEYLGTGAEVAVRSADVVAVPPATAPLHFIFHSAFCCSTLLARAFDLPGTAMGLKEPMLFNDIAGWQMRGAGGPALAAALGTGLTLLARPFGPGEAVIVKPSNVANALIAGTLQLQPQARALLLYAPLPVYLGSIVRKGLDGRLWARNLLVKQLQQGLHNLGFGVDDYLGQTDLQVAAMGWLVQQALFTWLIARYPDRLLGVDSETLMAKPETALVALGRHFGLTLDAAAIASGPAFNRHSKSGAAFDAAARMAETAAEAVHADEINKTLIWAEAVARSQGVPMALPAQLIG